MTDQTVGRARVTRFYLNKDKSGGYGFLVVRGYSRGLFFHTANGRKLNTEGTDFLEDEQEVVTPLVDQVLVYRLGTGRRGVEAILWAFAPDGSALI
jgi:hypothetical protein